MDNVETRAVISPNDASLPYPCLESGCAECNERGQCIRCAQLYWLMVDTRTCAPGCPIGYSMDVASSPDLQGHVCIGRRSVWENVEISGRHLAIIVGTSCAGAILLGLIIGLWVCIHKRRQKLKHAETAATKPVTTPTKMVLELDDSERQKFLNHLTRLRSDLHIFRQMLDETRRKFRRLQRGRESGADSKARAYRAVLRDLARVLSLLNRPDEHIRTLPADWSRLLNWAERVLRRYQRQQCAQALAYQGASTPSPVSSAHSSSSSVTNRMQENVPVPVSKGIKIDVITRL